MRLLVSLSMAACGLGACATGARAQPPMPLRRDQAVAAALARGARLGVASADTAIAAALLLTARARQNPVLGASYTRAVPQYHVVADLPLDLTGQRHARTRAAEAERHAAGLRFLSARAGVALAADTTYTRALGARDRLQLSLGNAWAADSLHAIAVSRRDAGDASDLEVELALVYAGQQANIAANDSLAYASAILDLQGVMGLAADGVTIVPTDALTPPTLDTTRLAATPATLPAPPPTLAVSAAQASLHSAALAIQAERRGVWAGPSLSAGAEMGDPTGSETGVLPTVGVSIPLPLLSRNRGAIAQAEAQRDRARAELALAQVESRTEIARVRRTLAVTLDKVQRDQRLVTAASAVASRSLTAYREGAATLASVLEAQRNAREVLAQYVTDVADSWVAFATLRMLTLTSPPAGAP